MNVQKRTDDDLRGVIEKQGKMINRLSRKLREKEAEINRLSCKEASNRSTKNAIKKSEADYRKLIEEQGKALYKLNKLIREKTSENNKLKLEMGHLRNIIKQQKIIIRELKESVGNKEV